MVVELNADVTQQLRVVDGVGNDDLKGRAAEELSEVSADLRAGP
jgi:hypothetical protein